MCCNCVDVMYDWSLSTFNIGYPHTRTTFNSYILQLPNGDYSVYRPKQWNHLCFAWSSGGKSKMVLVGMNQIFQKITHLFKQAHRREEA